MATKMTKQHLHVPMISKLLFVFSLMATFATSTSQACNVLPGELHKVSLAVDYMNTSTRFESLVRIVIRKPAAPFLLVIPGGPGRTIMQSDLGLLPTQFNLLLVDSAEPTGPCGKAPAVLATNSGLIDFSVSDRFGFIAFT